MTNIVELVNDQEQFFKNALTVQDIHWQKEQQFAIQALGNNKRLGDIALNNPISVQNAVINVAAIGISLNPALKHAYLVPRGGAICLDISYQGLLHIAMESGSIEWGQAKIVYANDTYANNGIDKAPNHSQDTFGAKGDPVGAYCTVKLPNGDYLTEEMDIAEIQKVQGTSKAGSGPWVTWWSEMARKTVVKRASKYWPRVARIMQATSVLNEHEGLKDDFIDGELAPVPFDIDQARLDILSCNSMTELRPLHLQIKKIGHLPLLNDDFKARKTELEAE